MLACQSYAHPLSVSLCDGNSRRASRRTPYVLTGAYILRLTVLSHLAELHVEPYVLTGTYILRLTVLSQLAGNSRRASIRTPLGLPSLVILAELHIEYHMCLHEVIPFGSPSLVILAEPHVEHLPASRLESTRR
jgi:hypothetical protein